MGFIKMILTTVASIIAFVLAVKLLAFILALVGFALKLVWLAVVVGFFVLVIWGVYRILVPRNASQVGNG